MAPAANSGAAGGPKPSPSSGDRNARIVADTEPDDDWINEMSRPPSKREMKDRDREQSQPYRDEFEQEERDRKERKPKNRPGSSKPRSAKPGGKSRFPKAIAKPAGAVASDGAGFLLGLIAYALVLNFIRGGPTAVRGWIAAKFINKPYTGQLGPVTPAVGGGQSGAGGVAPRYQ